MTWVDALALGTLGVAFWGGYRTGVIREIAGLLSVIAAWMLAGFFAGELAPELRNQWRLSPASAHLIAFWLLFLVMLVAMRLAGSLLERFAAAPVLKTISGIGGGCIACAKAVLILWLILFIARFFPVAPDVRETFGRSASVAAIEALDRPAIAMITDALPRHVRPYSRMLLRWHRF